MRQQTNNLHLQKIHYGYQTREGADLQQDAPTPKVPWLFDHVANMRSGDNLKYSSP